MDAEKSKESPDQIAQEGAKKPTRKPRTPKYQLSPAQLQQLETMSGYRLSMDKIAAILGFSKATLERYAKKQRAVSEAIEKGRAIASANVAQSAFEMAISKRNPTMTMFWLKTQEGWRETSRLELTGADGKPIETTGDMTPEQRQAEIHRLMKFMTEATPPKEPSGE